MNILVISQNFSRGGLETQIFTQYNIMKNTNKFYFAFASFNSNLNIEEAKIYKDFNFSADASIQEFCLDVEKLIKIIRENNIDVIHVHPFYSVFPAVFAAKLTNTPIIYSYHGYGSLNFPHQVNDVILLQCMLESEIDKVLSVTELGVSAINNATFTNKAIFLPNCIDLNKYKKHNIVNNKTWALISRIDNDKIEEIYQLISILDKIDIKKICIYGEGNKKEELEKFVRDNELIDKVILMGHSDNLSSELNGKYNGIIGIGRVVMEAIAMGYPTILIGFRKIAGVIDLKMYNNVKEYNFINRMIPNISIDKLSKQIKNVYSNKDERESLYNIFLQEYSPQKIYNQYKKEIESLQISNFYNLQKIYDEINNINDVNEKIYSSRLVYDILRRYIETESLSINLKNYFMNFNNYFSLLDINYRANINMKSEIMSEIMNEIKKMNDLYSLISDNNNNINNKIEEINNNIKELEDIQDSLYSEQTLLQDKINVKFLTYNTIQRIKLRRKKEK